jgi:hypothetical protein
MQGYRAILLSRFGVYPKNDPIGFQRGCRFLAIFYLAEIFQILVLFPERGSVFWNENLARDFFGKWFGYLT